MEEAVSHDACRASRLRRHRLAVIRTIIDASLWAAVVDIETARARIV
jgi:hypothetical protein